MKECIQIRGGGYTAEIRADHGGNCVRLCHEVSGAELLRTPPDEEAFSANVNVYGMPLLFPPNRIRDGCYTANGREYVFPINEAERHHHIHGVLSATPFIVTDAGEDSVTLIYQATAEKPYLQFPHAFTLKLSFTVSEKGLSQRLDVRNDSGEPMPFGAGFHTALRVPFLPGARREDCVIRLTCDKIWKYDSRIIPTLETADAGIYREGVPAAGSGISALLSMGNGGTAVMEDCAAGSRIRYEVSPGFRFWMLYNEGGNKGYFCPEPQTWIIDAPNLPLEPGISGFDLIAPGDSRHLETKLCYEEE